MAPPLVKGRALARRRLAGIVFLVVIALLVELTVALYQKRFTPVVDVALQTDRVGNQLSVHADVKLRGIVVGEVRKISSSGNGAVLQLALKPSAVGSVPRDVRAQLLPKTLFGEKEVALVLPATSSSRHLRAGDVIAQDHSTTALETETALNDLLPVLQALRPAELSMTLNALSTALRDRGDRIGANFAANAAYLRQINPELPRLAQDMQGVADLTNTYADTVPNIVRVLDNLSASSRSLQVEQASLDSFLKTTSTFAASAQTLLDANSQRFIALARDSIPSLQLYAAYSNNYPCLLHSLVVANKEVERTFGGAQPGLHITVEVVKDQAGYAPGDEPQYKEGRNPNCYGLGDKHVVPFPIYANTQDGYRDSDPPQDPGTGPPPSANPSAWLGPMTRTPTPGTTLDATLPAGTTSFGAVLLTALA